MVRKIILFFILSLNLSFAHDIDASNDFLQTHNLSQYKNKHVLILNSYHQSMPLFMNLEKGLEDALESQKDNIVFHIENMDTKRFYNKKYIDTLKKVYNIKYKDAHFDLILSIGNTAYDFLKNNKNELFKKTPVIFAGLIDYNEKDIDNTDEYTGIIEYLSIKENFDLIIKLHPNVKKIYVLNDYLKTGLAVKENIKKVIKKENYNIEFIFNKNLKIKELQKELDSLSSDTIVYLGSYFTDKEGYFFAVDNFNKLIIEHVKIPIYVYSKVRLSKNVVGGVVVDAYKQGQMIGLMVKNFFEGKKVKNIPVISNSPNDLILNYKQIIKFKIPKKFIPKNAIIMDNPLPVYDNYKATILTIILIIFIILIIIISIKNVKKQNMNKLQDQLEKKVERRTRELERTNNELESTLLELKETQEYLIHTEKMASLGDLVAGVAHEINTPIGMSLTGITHFIDISKNINRLYKKEEMSQEDFEDFLKDSDELARSINTNLVKAADLIRSFKEIAVDQSSEAQRTFNLKNYLEEVLLSLHHEIKRKKHTISINCSDDLVIVSYPGAFSQIITNLIMNSFIHAFKGDSVGNILIEVQVDKDILFLTYTDNGKGISQEYLSKIFDPFFTTNRNHGGSGLGLNIIYNIINTTLKGKIECSSIENVGIEFKIVIPMDTKEN